MSPEVLALENEAEALKNEGKNEEAIAKLQSALELDDKFARGHLAIAMLYMKTGAHEKAVEHGELAFKLDPDDLGAAALSMIYQQAFEATRDPKFIQKAEGVNTNLR